MYMEYLNSNLTFTKTVHKRNGEVVEEKGDTLYGLIPEVALNKAAHKSTADEFGDSNVTLKEYIKEFYANYRRGFCNETC